MRWRMSGTGWRVANSLVTLGRQLSDVWPQSGPTDGTLGDRSHAARKSDHNPNSANIVTAIDVDEVVEDRGQQLVDVLVASRDPRIKYIIHEGRIWRSYPKPGIPAWTPGPYTGSNAHLGHVHLSVSTLAALYDDPRRWQLDEGDTTMTTLKQGDTGNTVGLYQTALSVWNPFIAAAIGAETFPIDGAFGPNTVKAVKLYQKAAQLVTPYVADPDPYGQIGGLTAANLSRYVSAK